LLQTGTIQINGTLRGALYSRTQCALDITINEIDAEPEPYEDFEYGGVWTWAGFTADCELNVTESFKRGVIKHFGPNDPGVVEAGMLGSVEIGGDVGQSTAGNVARIICEYDEAARNLGATIHVHGDVYPSLDGNPAIFADGNLDGQILIDGSLRNGAGDEIEIEGALDPNSTATIAVDYDGWDPNDVWEPNATVTVDEVP
jgi:hypothetical protein